MTTSLKQKAATGRLELCMAILVMAVVGWNYLADARRIEGHMTSRMPPGYYGLLTEALLQGHLYLNVAADPILLRLANPYAGPQGAVRPHDMSFYRGKFYIYYGITPALLLSIPWKLLTGGYLTEVAMTACFCFGAFLLGAFWILFTKRRLFPGTSPWWTPLVLCVLGFGSPTYLLSNNPTFYAVPISAGCFCLMAAAILVDRAVRTKTLTRAALGLAGASLACGLAVGARPAVIPCLLLLLVPTTWLWLRRPRPALGRRPGGILWAAAILPAAAIGAGLALYNFERFANPFDFGIRYSLASGDLRNAHLMGLESFWKNLRLYLFGPVSFLRYYPFVYTTGQPMGVLSHLSLIAAALIFPLSLFSRRLRSDAGWWVGGSFLLGAALINLSVLCTWVLGGVDRYMVDFAPFALVLASGVLLALADFARSLRSPIRLSLQGLLLLAALWTAANGASLGLASRVATPFRARLEDFADKVVYVLERAFGSRQGPLELKLEFPQGAVGHRDPLVSTGNLLGTGDIVYVQYPDSGHVQFGFFHLGAGGPMGNPVPVDYSIPHTIVVELGSLYPPRRHPMFESWTDQQVSALRRHLEVRLDGRSAFKAEVAVYPSMPDGVDVGENRLAADVSLPRFEGRILARRRLGLQAAPSESPYPGGPVRLHLRWSRIEGASEPLVCTGRAGAGDLLNVEMLPGGRVRFQHDSWNNSDVVSEPFQTDLNSEHDVDVEMGSLYCDPKNPPTEALRRRLAVWLDGKPVIDLDRPFNPSTAEEVEFGYNAIGASSATAMFTGTILNWSRIPTRLLTPESNGWGPILMTVRFHNDVLGVNEPLVTTGMGYDARILYVHYEDSGHASFGYDRAGSGGDRGPTVPLDYSAVHSVEITLGSLFPEPTDPRWATHPTGSAGLHHTEMQIKLDGKVVFHAEHPVDTASHRQVTIGHNYVNTTHCQSSFSGTISDVRQNAW